MEQVHTFSCPHAEALRVDAASCGYRARRARGGASSAADLSPSPGATQTTRTGRCILLLAGGRLKQGQFDHSIAILPTLSARE